MSRDTRVDLIHDGLGSFDSWLGCDIVRDRPGSLAHRRVREAALNVVGKRLPRSLVERLGLGRNAQRKQSLGIRELVEQHWSRYGRSASSHGCCTRANATMVDDGTHSREEPVVRRRLDDQQRRRNLDRWSACVTRLTRLGTMPS